MNEQNTAQDREGVIVQPGAVLSWHWNLKIVLFAALFFPLTLALGIWQLQRAEQKREILAERTQRSITEPVALAELSPGDDHQYRRVWARGEAHSQRYFLLDNRIRRGRAGYEVLWPVKVEGFWILVNRGWIDGGLERRELPGVPNFESLVNRDTGVEGYLYRAARKAIVLGEQETITGWPQVVQQIDMNLLGERFGEMLFPYVLRLEGAPGKGPREFDDENGLETGWELLSVLPSKHVGYAVQWFAMAFALLVLTVVSNSNIGECLKYQNQQRLKRRAKAG